MPEQITLTPAEAAGLAADLKQAAALLLKTATSLEQACGDDPPTAPGLRSRVMSAVAKISTRSHRPGATFREIQRMLHADRATVGRHVHDLQEQRLLHVQPYKPWIGRPTQVVLLAH